MIIATAVMIGGVIGIFGSGVLKGSRGGHVVGRSVWCTRQRAGNALSDALLFPATAGRLCGGDALRDMTLVVTSGEGKGNVALEDGNREAPFTARQLGLEGSSHQVFLLTAAVDANIAALTTYGTAMLPIRLPVFLVDRYSGPTEISYSAFVFNNPSSPERLLSTPFYNRDGAPGWKRIGIKGADSWLTSRVRSLANGGATDFVFQRAAGDRWIQIAIAGGHLTMNEGLILASSATA